MGPGPAAPASLPADGEEVQRLGPAPAPLSQRRWAQEPAFHKPSRPPVLSSEAQRGSLLTCTDLRSVRAAGTRGLGQSRTPAAQSIRAIVDPILQIGRMGHREGELCTQGHTAGSGSEP